MESGQRTQSENTPESKKIIFGENTLIPAGFVIVIIGGVVWLTSLAASVSANSAALNDLKTDRGEFTNVVQSIDKRLSYIEGYMRRDTNKPMKQGEH